MSIETVSVTPVAPPSPSVPPTGAEPVTICSATGLALIKYPAKGTWRVFKTAFGPLAGRPRTSEDPSDWNRFDLPDAATLYSSTDPQGAYAEVLAPLRPRIEELSALAAAVFDDVDPGDNPIAAEWAEKGHMHVGSIPKVWHAERNLVQIDVATDGWYIDIEHPVSLQVLRSQFAGLLTERGLEDFDVSVIRGHDRLVTCAVAEWVNGLYLEDGSVPLGIRYNSRHATDWECWATFPDTKTIAAHTIGLDHANTDLRAIARLFKLRLHW
ncbi:hypothetical protein GCM10023339_18800 [Alloalcanivorax gelatiniphagus]